VLSQEKILFYRRLLISLILIFVGVLLAQRANSVLKNVQYYDEVPGIRWESKDEIVNKQFENYLENEGNRHHGMTLLSIGGTLVVGGCVFAIYTVLWGLWMYKQRKTKESGDFSSLEKSIDTPNEK
jgi:hypothetical protein